ncbi:hypothetical protein BDP27DRAFT_834116 [Rhodocollybia butyracea]|uniref:Uncharacterized protein n=1 Tax=Rhodocollybia butyracea TaxID=206335 RepID=A0A9P5U6Q5_9AGAR|nr:hypothetical protein BDP27DRAFT_834116 [Rhodocollybia butyracea]
MQTSCKQASGERSQHRPLQNRRKPRHIHSYSSCQTSELLLLKEGQSVFYRDSLQVILFPFIATLSCFGFYYLSISLCIYYFFMIIFLLDNSTNYRR